MKKFLICIVSFLFFCTFIFSADGIFWGEKNIKCLKTKWFDIIFAEENYESAQKLYFNADAIYEDVAASYGMEPRERMPVVITTQVEMFNAYWSNEYYNHIVLFDTATTTELEVFSEDFLSTFRHEVTHAFTYNMTNDFWKKISCIFGDSINFSGSLVTPGWAEGATLTSESSKGEGRLNNDFAKQQVRQAKIEGKFPKYNEVQGARDIYPVGSYYYFNGAFNQWLQDNFGMEKYSELWYRMINFKNFSVQSAFRTVYEIELKTAWENFFKDYKLPENIQNPEETDFIYDFFESENHNYSINNNAGALYKDVHVCQTGLYYSDDKTDSIFFVSNEELKKLSADFSQNKSIKPQRVFIQDNLIEAKPSSDGRFIVLNWYSTNAANYKLKTGIFDTQTKRLFEVPGFSLKNSAIITNENDYYLVSEYVHAQTKKLLIQKIDFEKNKIKHLTKVQELQLAENTSLSAVTDLQNGNFACIKKARLDYSILIMDIEGNLQTEYKTPVEKMVIRFMDFKPESQELCFSFTVTDSMPGFGKLNLHQNKFELLNENFSGGIYYPALFEDQLIYAGFFYTQNRLLTAPQAALSPFAYPALASAPESVFVTEPESENKLEELGAKDYHTVNYLNKGVFIPISLVKSVSYDPLHEGSYSLPFGITFRTNDPLSAFSLQFSAGYGPHTNSFGADVVLTSGTSTPLFKYQLTSGIECDRLGFKQVNENLILSSSIYCGPHSAILSANTTTFHYGRSNISTQDFSKLEKRSFDSAAFYDSPNYIYVNNSTSVGYSNIYRSGPGKFEYAGFRVKGIVFYSYNAIAKDAENVYRDNWDLGLTGTVKIPKLLPFTNKQGFVTNLPTEIQANLFCVTSTNSIISDYVSEYIPDYFPVYDLASANIETIIFGTEIQKPFLGFLYLNDFKFSLNYCGGFSATQEIYKDNWKITKMDSYVDLIKSGKLKFEGYPYLKITTGITLNVGGLTDCNYTQDLCLKIGVVTVEEKPTVSVSCGMDFRF